jgi:hypothetical protein
MSYEVWGEPDDGPELPEGWLDEDAAQDLRDRIKELEALLAAQPAADNAPVAAPSVGSVPGCTCSVRLMPGQLGATHSQDCPVTHWGRAAFKASGENAQANAQAPSAGSVPVDFFAVQSATFLPDGTVSVHGDAAPPASTSANAQAPTFEQVWDESGIAQGAVKDRRDIALYFWNAAQPAADNAPVAASMGGDRSQLASEKAHVDCTDCGSTTCTMNCSGKENV